MYTDRQYEIDALWSGALVVGPPPVVIHKDMSTVLEMWLRRNGFYEHGERSVIGADELIAGLAALGFLPCPPVAAKVLARGIPSFERIHVFRAWYATKALLKLTGTHPRWRENMRAWALDNKPQPQQKQKRAASHKRAPTRKETLLEQLRNVRSKKAWNEE